MSILLFRYVRRASKNHSSPSPKTPLSFVWKLLPFFIVKAAAKRWCPTKRINNTMYVEAFPKTFISIGPAK